MKITKNLIIGIVALCCVVMGSFFLWKNHKVKLQQDDSYLLSMGSPQAMPVDIYMSLSCPHCAAFYTDVLPRVQEAFVDTGKIYIRIHLFVFEASSFDGSVVAYCLAPSSRKLFVGHFFEAKRQGITASTQSLAEDVGVSQQEYEACLVDKKSIQKVFAEKEQATQNNIDGVPAFKIGRQWFYGEMSFSEMAEKMDEMLMTKESGEKT